MHTMGKKSLIHKPIHIVRNIERCKIVLKQQFLVLFCHLSVFLNNP